MERDTYVRLLEMAVFAAIIGAVIFGCQIYSVSAASARSAAAVSRSNDLGRKIDAVATACRPK